IQRNHPPVEEFVGRQALASEIVDDEHAVVGLHLHGSGIELGDRVQLQLQHLQRQFSANQDSWALAEYPAGIAVLGSRIIDLRMEVRIIDTDNLPVDLYGKWYPDALLRQYLGNRSRDRSFSRSRRPIEEDRST